MIKQCETCRGTKRVKGLGLIEKECRNCDGIGWVDISDENVKQAKNVSGSDVEIRIKRGRKPKTSEVAHGNA